MTSPLWNPRHCSLLFSSGIVTCEVTVTSYQQMFLLIERAERNWIEAWADVEVLLYSLKI